VVKGHGKKNAGAARQKERKVTMSLMGKKRAAKKKEGMRGKRLRKEEDGSSR